MVKERYEADEMYPDCLKNGMVKVSYGDDVKRMRMKMMIDYESVMEEKGG